MTRSTGPCRSRRLPAGRAVARTVVVGVALACLALLAGCGGSSSPSVASLTSTTQAAGATGTSTSAPLKPSPAAFASCLGLHGFSASVGSAGTADNQVLSIAGVIVTGNVDPSSSQFQAAMQACRKFLPGGGPPALSPSQQAEAARAMTSFAACMRKHGVPNFPDPNGQGRFPLATIEKLDPNTPLFQNAFKACESLEPKVGPRISFG
jgi:hypothetical protein